MERISNIYHRSPQEALEETFKRTALKCPWAKDQIFMWCSVMGIDKTRYGRYRTVTRDYLVGRQYKIEFWDGAVSLFWLDAVHLPRGGRTLLINELFDEKAENFAR
jgi:hypothetical protein